MSTRMVTALAVGSLVLVAGCSGGDGDSKSEPPPTSAESTPTASQPRYTTFADFPGKDFVTTEPGMRLGVRVKPVDTSWTPELAGKSADAGKHYVAVYVAVTGELADRGVEDVKLQYLRLKFKSTERPCEFGESGYCYGEAYPSSEIVELDDVQEDAGGDWRSYSWRESFLGRDIERGVTKIGVVGFSLPDTEKATSFELCGPTKEAMVDTDEFACVPIKAPDRT
ncbi:hypothetical protein J7E93_18405 [Streptomyces sp. ISL-36]|uniref:hypothetical protein n=1 Tax=Streptomyces sp. ISL-36 TaxID=2819182 RepID=UPI001BE5766C|nr:hypothetical protein [Streptomyces sp. ISL-36]MBT2442043.1 hypothetical protein [Streptomyces sp. ISL-36]